MKRVRFSRVDCPRSYGCMRKYSEIKGLADWSLSFILHPDRLYICENLCHDTSLVS
jgi:hypothetical protein